MKKIIILTLALYLHTIVAGQFYVQSGTQLYIGGTLTLQDEDFIRASGAGPVITFEPGSNVLFTGNADNVISGYIGFLNLEIAKSGSHKVSLQNSNEEVKGQLVFTSGFFDLNNNTLFLNNTGTLVNENENTCIIGPAGGEVQAHLTLNQPSGINPGNIGATITSSKDFGDVTISRGFAFAFGMPAKAIQRYYTINFSDPAKDNDLDATLRLQYFDTELNGADESKLVHWKYDNTANAWVEQNPPGNISRNTVDNWVQLVGINTLSPWTLAETSGAVPVTFSLFNVVCEDKAAVINWQTASESNSNFFEIQRSTNGRDWATIGKQNAAGQSNSLHNYHYTDQSIAASAKIFYRIKSIDFDGKENFTVIHSTTCGLEGNWQVWPNPVQHQIHISLSSDGVYKTSIHLLDSKGSQIRQWNKELQRGNNQIELNIQDLPSGAYHLIMTWDGGRGFRSTKILKQ